MKATLFIASIGLAAVSASAANAAKPENVARKAKATASSEFSPQFAARCAIDGIVPESFDGPDDTGVSWAINGAKGKDRGTFVLEWPEPVQVAEMVYYARWSWPVGDAWKDYRVRFDDSPAPAAQGAFERTGAPQRIKVQPAMVRKITFDFLSAHGGPNPGAGEIEVFDQPVPAAELAKYHKGGVALPEESSELAEAVREGKLGFDKLLVVQRHELNPSHIYTACCEGFQPGGGLDVLAPPTPDGQLRELVASPTGMIMDADVSYNGQEILFSWRRTEREGYHIYRVNADGSGLRQLTDGECHDYNVAWLPDGGIAFLSTRAGVVALCFFTPSGVLYRMDRDGGNLRRLSANYVNDFTPAVLNDGRILYTRWEYVDKPAAPIQSLWTIHPDGTNLSVFFGNGILSPATFIEARPIPGSTAVLCTLTAHNGPIRGGVGVLDRNHGLDAQAAITNLTPQVNIGRVYQGDGNSVRGPFENPYPIDSRRFLVSRGGSICVGDLSGRWAALRLRNSPLGFYSPQPLRARPVPPIIASSLDPRDVTGPTRPTGPTGPMPSAEAIVYILDVYDGLEPHVRRGTVRQIAVVQELSKPHRVAALGFGFQRPVISCGATYAPKRIWGYARVEADGSACFRVPTGVPIYFLALDETGQAVQRMRSFTHFAPGERRGCVGCHEPRNTTPIAYRQHPAGSGTASVPLAPGGRTASVPLAPGGRQDGGGTVGTVLALNSPPRTLEPPEWGVENFSYPQVVQPVLDRHCLPCHSGPDAPNRIDLTGARTDWFSVSYDVLTRGHVSWIDTRNGNEANILQVTPKAWGSPASRLTKVLLSGHPDKDGKPRIALDDASRRRIFAWIDLNVPYYSTYDMAHPDLEGGRRLVPKELPARLAAVAQRRCASCHARGIPSCGFIRVTEPHLNDFLVAPLARAAGGRESCAKPVFVSRDDPDYQALLKLFEPVRTLLAERPRMDMPGARPAKVDCSSQ